MGTLLTDFRFALRTLVKSPGFTIAALLTLAVGIGANTAIFSVVYGILLRPLDFPQPERLYTVWENQETRGGPAEEWPGRSVFSDWRERNQSFEGMAAIGGWGPDLTGIDRPESLNGAQVSPGYFSVLGVEPALGRGFRREEERPGEGNVVVLSHGLWSRRFGAEPGLVGGTVTLSGTSYTVVGVMPEGFRPPIVANAEIWRPLEIDPAEEDRGNYFLRVIGRLRPDVTPEQARDDMARVAAALGEEYPTYLADVGVTLTPLHETMVGQARLPLLALLGAVVLVLLIACANVANLLLARASARQRELAVRTALGASRRRLVRQLLTESVLLALAGGAAGLLLGVWGMDLFRHMAPAQVPRLAELRLDSTVLAFTLGVSLLTGLLFGLAPALGAGSRRLTGALAEGSRGSSAGGHSRLRGLLVVTELALGLALLVGAGLLIRSLSSLAEVDPGFRLAGVVSGAIGFPESRYPERAEAALRLAELEERLAARPGVAAVGAVSVLPLSGSQLDVSFGIEGRMPRPGDEPGSDIRRATPGYFPAMSIPLLRGRLFDSGDGPEAPLAVLVSQRFVELYFPGEDPVGKRMRIGDVGEDSPWWTVVGVVGGVRDNTLDKPPDPELYIPFAQRPSRGINLVARATGDPGMAIAALREVVAEVDPDQAVAGLATLEDLKARSLAPTRFLTGLLGAFAVLALGLAAVGVYGVIAYAVGQRTREIGIRMAMGARGRDILGMVLSWGGVMIGLGLAAGLLLSWWLGKALAGLLFAVEPSDPLTLGTVSALLAAVALTACLVPALRAARLDPMLTLRSE